MARQPGPFDAFPDLARRQKFARSLLLGVALISLSDIVQAQRSAGAGAKCYTSTSSHVESSACLENEARITERRMIQAEGNLLAALEQSHELLEERQRMATALDEASAAYSRAREAECDLQAALAAGGNAANDRRLLCRIELDDRRIADLLAATAAAPR